MKHHLHRPGLYTHFSRIPFRILHHIFGVSKWCSKPPTWSGFVFRFFFYLLKILIHGFKTPTNHKWKKLRSQIYIFWISLSHFQISIFQLPDQPNTFFLDTKTEVSSKHIQIQTFTHRGSKTTDSYPCHFYKFFYYKKIFEMPDFSEFFLCFDGYFSVVLYISCRWCFFVYMICT